jgi:hypothetical protein
MRCRQNLRRSIRALALLLLLAACGLHAGEICVTSAPLLQVAFAIGAGQSQPFTIKMVQGTYSLSGQTSVTFSAPTTILGGYNANCTARTVNPANTIIDIGGAASSLQMFQPVSSPKAGLTIDGLTIANGSAFSLSTGHYNLTSSDDPGDLTVTHSRIHSMGAGSDAATLPVYFASTGGTARLENLVVDGISSNFIQNCSVAVSLQGDTHAMLNYVTMNLSDAHDLCFFDGTGSSGGSYQFDVYNSIVWASDGSLVAIHTDPYNADNDLTVNIGYSILRAHYGAGNIITTNNLDADPLWTAPGSADYHLKAASPAVNSGDIIDPLGTPSTDIVGGTRWIGTHPDRGAYESTINDLTTFVVTSTADAGPNTLRQAMLDANSSINPATIKFNIATPCPAQIKLTTALPHVTSPITIDGYTQAGAAINTDPDASNATLCVLLIPASGALGTALQVPAAGAESASLVVRGLGFGGFGQPVMLLGGSNHVIAGDQFGGSVGGVALAGAALQPISIGVNAGGSLIIGGQSIADRNIIGGGGFYGINVQSTVISTPDQCRIVNNLIGVAANGITPIPNFTGIGLSGGGCTVTSNRIVGNSHDAILINGGNGNLIQGNVLGVDVNGNGIFNDGAGVHINSGTGNVIGTSASSSITGLLFSNTIRFMVDGGVLATGGTGNSIRSNLIYDNGTTGTGMDIDLGVVGPTLNDADDVDGGPNLLQNFPLVNGVAFAVPASPNAANVTGTLNAQPGNYRVDAYFANGCNANGRGHAQAYAGAKLVTIPAGSTHASFTLGATLPNLQASGVLALAATDAAGNTSEIGPCAPIDSIFRYGHE